MAILVNDELVDEELIRAEAKRLKEVLKAEQPENDGLALELRAREWARENVIVQTLLRQAAGAESPEDMMSLLIAEVPPPKAKEVIAYYKEFRHVMRRPELTRAAHIVKSVDEGSTEEQASAAIREIEGQLKAGADFGKVADSNSDCPGGGGDLGFFARGEMVPEFDEAVARLKPGEMSGIFRTPFGFHIAKVMERRTEGPASLDDVRKQIEEDLWKEKKDRVLAHFIRELREKAVVRKA